MSIVTFPILASALIILVPLVRGAISDIKTRTFPKEYWVLPSRAAGFFTVLTYLLLLMDKDYALILVMAVISIVFGSVLYILGMQCGSGGDYRALIYISILTPTLALVAVPMAAVYGIVLVLGYRARGLSAPWAVGILAGFLTAIASYTSAALW